jgi:phosphodiester glycosidase
MARIGVVLMLGGAVTVGLSEPAWAETPVPAGYQVTVRENLAPGVEHLRLVRSQPPLVVHVARVAPDAPVTLRAVLSNEQVAGSEPLLERTTSMCLRVRCIVATNADFFSSGQPLGGLITDGQLLRSPSSSHHQLSVTRDGKLEAGSFEWSGKLVPTDLRALSLDGVNVPRTADGIVLFTPAFGPSTEASAGGAEISLRLVEPGGPLRLGQTAMVELVSFGEGQANSPILPDGAVLSGQGKGAEALRQLWHRVRSGAAGSRALLRLETADDVVESVGGSPILIREGKRWFTDPGDAFTDGLHPRTLVGWTAAGDALLVTVDGRQPGVSVGMSLPEAADLLLALGAVDGINLDGGGSTTFVANGAILNQPSDVAVRRRGQEAIQHSAGAGEKVIGHVERPVVSALAVVPSNEVAVPAVDPLAGLSLGLPQALALTVPTSSDPGSVPGGALPALVSRSAPELGGPLVPTAIAFAMLSAAAVGTWMVRRRLEEQYR